MSRYDTHPLEKPHHPHWPLACALFAFVLLQGLFSIHEPATWLHIKTGAKILADHALPRWDAFSYTVAGRPWTTDSWLADVLFHLLHQYFGPAALILAKAAAVAGAFALLLPFNPGNPLLAAFVLGCGALASWTGITETPAFFDPLILALLLRLLRPRRDFHWILLVQVGALEFFWANLHGSTAILGLWLVALKVFKASLRTAESERLDYIALLIVAGLGLALNPHGFEVTQHLFNEAQQGYWRPLSPWFNLYALFAACGAAACWVCLQQEFFLTMTAASLLALSLILPELRPVYLLSACPVISLALGHLFMPLKDTSKRVTRWSLLMASLLALHWFLVYVPLARSRGYGAVSLEGAVRFLDSHGVSGRLFNEPEAGAFLIGQSDRPVFADGRSALYGASFMRDAQQWPDNFNRLAAIYAFDYAVILNRRSRYPARLIDEDPDWRLAYADDDALVYIRESGADSGLAKNSLPGFIQPNRLWPESLDMVLARKQEVGPVLTELDRWGAQSPASLQPLVWKAYALERLRLWPKAEGLIALAEKHPRLKSDPELMAALAFAHEKTGRMPAARRLYLRASVFARRRGDGPLESVIAGRLTAMMQSPAGFGILERK